MNSQLNRFCFLIKQAGWLILLFCLTGCLPADKTGGNRWIDFYSTLTNTQQFASIRPERTGYLSTFDPAGGNNDYNNFVGRSAEPGWVVLGDFKGPGVIDRMWLTGVDAGYPLRFYFDGEKEPRLQGAIDQLFGAQRKPFVYPVAQQANQCWWSYIPLTFAKSLRIEALMPPVHRFWGPRRLYVQLNSRSLNSSVESFPAELPVSFASVAEEVSEKLTDSMRTDARLTFPNEPVRVPAGEEQVLLAAKGPASIPGWAVRIHFEEGDLPESTKNAILQQAVLQIYYDGLEQPSVSVPLGDFFCNGWRKRNLSCLVFSSVDDGFVWHLPTPFRQSVKIALSNVSGQPLLVDFIAEPVAEMPDDSGYLHAAWNKSGPDKKGYPHVLADLQGTGKYIGCFLGVTSVDKSWWILEGDDVMQVDGRRRSGTGLEDYFNGGWYYRGCSFSPWSGVLDRCIFRTAQYRFHLHDAVSFEQKFSMSFERGDQNISAGFMRSTAYFYLKTPQAVPDAALRKDIKAEANPFESYSLMLQLFELERARDYGACIRQIDEWLETNAASGDAGVLRLRRLEYERLRNGSVSADAYAPFLAGNYGDEARQQAVLLVWFYEKPDRYLVGAANNIAGQVAVDGQTVLSEFNPLQLMVSGIELPPGNHTIRVHASPNRVVPWVQTGIRGHSGLAGTGPDCLVIRSSGEKEITAFMDVMRGPPHDEQYVNARPNAFVLLQSEIYGIRAANWDATRDPADFVVEFNTGDLSVSPFGQAVLGLPLPEKREGDCSEDACESAPH
jgi:hypothetical protein